jgi:hypothetical protein
MLSKTKGAHRFIWDLHYTPVDVPPTYPIGAVYQKTAPNTNSPWVMPGTYTVKLLANGQTLSQQLIVKMDPRVKTSVIDLQLQFDWTKKLYDLRKKVRSIITKDASLNKEKSNIDSQLASIIDLLQDADNKPTTQALDAATVLIANANKWISVAGK